MHPQITTHCHALPPTTSRHEWLLQRQNGIGSSDASAIAGLSTWESPYSLWEIKTGRAPLDPPVDDRTRELREWGHRMEPVIRQATADHLGIEIHKPDVAYQRIEHPWQFANLDGETDDPRICEFKNVHGQNRKEWIGQIPDHAEIQVHHAGLVTGIRHAIVAGLIGGSQLIVHEIELNANILEMLHDMEQRWWQHVLDDTEPPIDGHVRTMEAITREWAHKPGSQEIAAIDIQDHWEAWREADEAEKAAAKRKRQALAHIAALMDGHQTITTGKRVWARAQRGRLNMTLLNEHHPDLVAEYTRKPAFDLDAFKADHPDIYAQHQHTSIRPIKEK